MLLLLPMLCNAVYQVNNIIVDSIKFSKTVSKLTANAIHPLFCYNQQLHFYGQNAFFSFIYMSCCKYGSCLIMPPGYCSPLFPSSVSPSFHCPCPSSPFLVPFFICVGYRHLLNLYELMSSVPDLMFPGFGSCPLLRC